MKIYEIMTSKVYCVSQEDSILFVMKEMREKDVGCIVIEENKKPIGIITDRDIVLSLSKDLSPHIPISKIMKKYVVTINQNEDVSNASDLMGCLQMKRLVVTNDFEEIVGILTLSDLARNVLTEEYAFEALSEISYNYSTNPNQNDKNIQISAFMV